MLGIKQLAWDSVQIPMIMPKPDLIALTGGYRKTPVLQVGADIYCDTNCIARELERRHPAPTLFPDGGAGARARARRVGRSVFRAGCRPRNDSERGSAPGPHQGSARVLLPHGLSMPSSRGVPHLYAQLLAHTALVEEQLEDGRAYLQGARPGLADITAFYVISMVRGFLADAASLLAPFARLQAWEAGACDRPWSTEGHRLGAGARGRAAVAASACARCRRRRSPRPACRPAVSVTPDDYGKVPVVRRARHARPAGDRDPARRSAGGGGRGPLPARSATPCRPSMIDLHFFRRRTGSRPRSCWRNASRRIASCRSISCAASSSRPPTCASARITRYRRSSTTMPQAVRCRCSNRVPSCSTSPRNPVAFSAPQRHGRYDVMQWLFWQVGGLGPMAGQAHHFRAFASESVPYGIRRYTDE